MYVHGRGYFRLTHGNHVQWLYEFLVQIVYQNVLDSTVTENHQRAKHCELTYSEMLCLLWLKVLFPFSASLVYVFVYHKYYCL